LGGLGEGGVFGALLSETKDGAPRQPMTKFQLTGGQD